MVCHVIYWLRVRKCVKNIKQVNRQICNIIAFLTFLLTIRDLAFMLLIEYSQFFLNCAKLNYLAEHISGL